MSSGVGGLNQRSSCQAISAARSNTGCVSTPLHTFAALTLLHVHGPILGRARDVGGSGRAKPSAELTVDELVVDGQVLLSQQRTNAWAAETAEPGRIHAHQVKRRCDFDEEGHELAWRQLLELGTQFLLQLGDHREVHDGCVFA